jgi:ABC-type phosphate transport system auxiliary subunit
MRLFVLRMAPSKLQLLQAEVAKNQASLLARSHLKYINEYTFTLQKKIDQLQRELDALTGPHAKQLLINEDTSENEENVSIQSCLNLIHSIESTPGYIANDEGVPVELAEFHGDENIKSKWIQRIQGQVRNAIKNVE